MMIFFLHYFTQRFVDYRSNRMIYIIFLSTFYYLCHRKQNIILLYPSVTKQPWPTWFVYSNIYICIVFFRSFFPPNFVYRLRADDWLEFRKTTCAPRQVGRAEKTITNTSRYEHGDDARPAGPRKYCELVLTEAEPIYCDIILCPQLLCTTYRYNWWWRWCHSCSNCSCSDRETQSVDSGECVYGFSVF